jgi:gamma-tubulin complex component 3
MVFNSVLKYSDIAGLERSIDTAYEIASQRLLEVFFDKFMLMDHLRGLKQYLLLGHGDFVDALMGSLAFAPLPLSSLSICLSQLVQPC